MDYSALRKQMVHAQLVPRGIIDKRVLDAFLKVERHLFLPESLRFNAYADCPQCIGESQTISQPYIVALMTQCLCLAGSERVLEIGTGSGYQTAILAELAAEVYSVERFEKFSQKAGELFRGLGHKNIKLKVGDGTLGWQEQAPFDRIIVTAAGSEIPVPLIDQLKDRGRLVIPLGDSYNQMLTVVEKKNGRIEPVGVCSCVFVPLVGEHGQKNIGD